MPQMIRRTAGNTPGQDADADHLLAYNEARSPGGNTTEPTSTSWKTINKQILFERLPKAFGLQSQHRRYEQHNTGNEWNYEGEKQSKSARVKVVDIGRITMTVVIVLLAFCGVVSLALLTLGFLIMNPITEEQFLPHWGEPGHSGEAVAGYPTDFTRDIVPVPCHSHNDYWRRVPLYEAIHNGFISVEADVWLMSNDLLVGHKESSLTRQRNFRSMYIEPIAAILEHQNPSTEFSNDTRNGVFDTDPDQSLILLVDFKTPGYRTLPAVHEQLQLLRSKNYLTYFDGQKVMPRQVTVVATGNAPFDMLTANTTYRDIFFDAPLDLIWQDSDERRVYENGQPIASLAPQVRATGQGQGQIGIGNIINASVFDGSNSYYASVSFTDVFGWPQLRAMNEHQIKLLRGQIKAAHRQGLRVRYWNTPSWPIGLRNSIWKTLVEEGADILNADDLKAAAHGDWRYLQSWWFW